VAVVSLPRHRSLGLHRISIFPSRPRASILPVASVGAVSSSFLSRATPAGQEGASPVSSGYGKTKNCSLFKRFLGHLSAPSLLRPVWFPFAVAPCPAGTGSAAVSEKTLPETVVAYSQYPRKAVGSRWDNPGTKRETEGFAGRRARLRRVSLCDYSSQKTTLCPVEFEWAYYHEKPAGS